MLTIGLTGGIGSGKTAASDHFQHLGIHIVDADIVAREVVTPGTAALTEIEHHFGHTILNTDKSLDRAKLREIIFNNENEKKWLENLLHPIIRNEILNQLSNANSSYAILVSPLLFETDQHTLVTRTLLIDIPESLQIERASSRDQNTKEQIKKIVEAQAPRSYKLEKADDVITNDKTLEKLHSAIEEKHLYYLELAHAKASRA